MRFPDLPALSVHEVQKIQLYCASGKGLAFDAISDTWMRQTERRDLLADVWRHEAIQALARSFEARLIPLNKVWPDIPQADQFRPIVVLSPMFKWLELRFLHKL